MEVCRFACCLLLAVCAAAAFGAIPVTDFRLLDTNPQSPRSGQLVSPRDYLFQISAFYFAETECAYCQTQFGILNDIQNELRSSNSDFNVEIIGVNDGPTENNAEMTTGRKLPWLQNTTDVWKDWKVNFRDVRILNPQNEAMGVFNLTEHNLLISSNRETLKGMLLHAAKAVDLDQDYLPDIWELSFFGNLDQSGGDDADHDGYDNFTELAFRTNPTDALSKPRIFQRFNANNRLEVVYRRWPGSLLTYEMKVSSELTQWQKIREINLAAPAVNLFDGSGASEVTFSLPYSKEEQPISFILIQAFPRN
jgi:hypothetical protein